MYFLETPCNEWNMKKAFIRYLQDKDFQEVKDCMKKDLLLMRNSDNFGKKIKGRIDDFLESLKHNSPDPDMLTRDTPNSSSQTNNFNNGRDVKITYNENNKRVLGGSSSSRTNTAPKKQRNDKVTPEGDKDIDQLFGTDNTAGTTKLPRIPTRIEDLDPADFASTSNNPYIVQEKNISDILCEYQKAIAAKNNKEGLIVELNTHELLALNNVLLIKHGQHSKMMLDFFSEDTLKNIKLDLIDRFKIEDIDFNKNIRDKLDDILKELKKDNITSKQASKFVINLTSDDRTFNSTDSLISGVYNLIQKIPKTKFNGPIRENAISCSYADSILSPIFTIPDEKKHLLWLNTKVLENSSKQPDFACQKLLSSNWTGPTMVGEVKGEDQKDDKYICLLDLVRIGCISVDTVNLNLYDGVIGIHVVALQATFFFTTLVADGFYVMLEICTIPLPRDVTELRSYITYFDDLLTVIQYSSKCEVCSDKKTLESMTARKISTPEFDRVITSSRNRRRECPIVYHH